MMTDEVKNVLARAMLNMINEIEESAAAYDYNMIDAQQEAIDHCSYNLIGPWVAMFRAIRYGMNERDDYYQIIDMAYFNKPLSEREYCYYRLLISQAIQQTYVTNNQQRYIEFLKSAKESNILTVADCVQWINDTISKSKACLS